MAPLETGRMLTYNDPGAWWGWHGWENQPGPLSATQLIAAGSLSSELAAVLWLLMEHGRSIIVSSPPQQAGKTTTLTALLSFVPDKAVGYFSRGADEEFAVPPLGDGVPTYLMINELSDHLPIYTWGRPAQRAFALVAEGYALASTMHARDARETLTLLARDGGVDPAYLGHLDVVLSLRLRLHGREPERHACELALITPDASAGYRIETIGERAPLDPAFGLTPGALDAVAALIGVAPDVVRARVDGRRRCLERLVGEEQFDYLAVHQEVRQFAEEEAD